jgi:hypothetical protein
LYAALGADGEKPLAERLHSSAMYSALRMDAFFVSVMDSGVRG